MQFRRVTDIRLLALAIVGLLLVAAPASAQRTLSRPVYLDKLHGMWFGQLIANHSGRPVEGHYNTREPAPDSTFAWVIKTTPADPWTGDDDTGFEYLYLHTLETYGLNPSPAAIQQEWADHVVAYYGIFIANLQAKILMGDGLLPPDTGSYRYNMHAYAIDSQITTESLGAMAPGLRQRAIDAAGTFGGVSNSGFSLHAAQYYAAMYATAAFESDVETIVLKGQECLPHTSRTWQVIQDVRNWYAADRQDGVLDWPATRRLLYDHYVGDLSFGRHRYWIESTINTGLTTLALLYGQGDFEQTVRIAILGGFDADCNSATAGGLIGMVKGYAALPIALTAPATDAYRLVYLQGLPANDTITNVAARMQAIGEQTILAAGGSVDGDTYTLPAAHPVATPPEHPDPTGPGGLVGAVLAAGGTVTTSASVNRHSPAWDRYNLDAIIDGITDVTYNGHVPYSTQSPGTPEPPPEDFYQLNFSRPVRFDALTFYEGDLVWNDINGNPRLVPPAGGFFTSLAVDVHTAQGWVPAQHVTLSEPLDPYAYYQVIGIQFDALWGDGIRIHGAAGGTQHFTTIVELTAHGALLPADLNGDLRVDALDLAFFSACQSGPQVPVTAAACRPADVDGDGDADQVDFGIIQGSLGGS